MDSFKTRRLEDTVETIIDAKISELLDQQDGAYLFSKLPYVYDKKGLEEAFQVAANQLASSYGVGTVSIDVPSQTFPIIFATISFSRLDPVEAYEIIEENPFVNKALKDFTDPKARIAITRSGVKISDYWYNLFSLDLAKLKDSVMEDLDLEKLLNDPTEQNLERQVSTILNDIFEDITIGEVLHRYELKDFIHPKEEVWSRICNTVSELEESLTEYIENRL